MWVGSKTVLRRGYGRNYNLRHRNDLVAIAQICRRQNSGCMWMAPIASSHISDQHRNLVEGIELSDSLTIGSHKWPGVPLRRPDALQSS